MSERVVRRIAMVGFGEAGSILGAELAAAGCDVVTYDILLDTPASRGPMLEKARQARVRTAVRQDALVDAMAAHGLTYPHGEAFSWRSLADALAATENNPTRGK